MSILGKEQEKKRTCEIEDFAVPSGREKGVMDSGQQTGRVFHL